MPPEHRGGKPKPRPGKPGTAGNQLAVSGGKPGPGKPGKPISKPGQTAGKAGSGPTGGKPKPKPTGPKAPSKAPPPPAAKVSSEPVRLNKRIADSGLCARRKADELIDAKRVMLNGKLVTELGIKVLPSDKILVDGKPLPQATGQTVAFHKPIGIVTSRKAGRNQKSLYSLLPPELQSCDPAGRLDQESSGLIIMSGDGDLIQRITHPRYHLSKLYEISTDKPLTRADQNRLLQGVMLEPEEKLARMTAIEPIRGSVGRYRVTLVTGYNRQIRRSLNALGYRVNTLSRVQFGPIMLGGLKPGEWRALSPREIGALLKNAPGSAAPPPQKGQKAGENQDRKPGQPGQQAAYGQPRQQGKSQRPPARPGGGRPRGK